MHPGTAWGNGGNVPATYLSLEQLAERLGVRPRIVYGLRYRGEAPPAIKVGRQLRFRLEDVEAWELARRDNGSTRATA